METSKQTTQAVLQAMNGDADAFSQVIQVHARAVYTQIYLILRNHQDAEDVSQDTFFKAFKYLHKLDDPQKIKPWLLSIARNLSRDFLRRRRRATFCQLLAAGELPDPAGPPGSELEAADRRNSLSTALAGLPEDHRTALSMRYLDRCSHETIEQSMGVSNGRLRGLLGRALKQLRKSLGRNGI